MPILTAYASNGIPKGMLKDQLASHFDHTCLKPDATDADIKKLCEEALEWEFFAVCVESKFIDFSRNILKGSLVKVATVIDFPNGNENFDKKVSEIKNALDHEADEIDFVMHRAYVLEKRYNDLYEEFCKLREISRVPLKVILETSELSNEEKSISCALAKMAGLAFVKTSTGFSKSGAHIEDVRLMRKVVGPQMGVKASGGIRDLETAIQMIESGANRLGTSASVHIMQGLKAGNNGGY